MASSNLPIMKGFDSIVDDALLRGLVEAMVTAVSLASLFALPSFLTFFEGANPAWHTDETLRLRRSACPLLKDPDSLLSIQLIIRFVLIVHLVRYGITKMRVACGQSIRSRVLSSASAVLFFAGYGAKIFLYQYSPFHLAGPMGGAFPLVLEIITAAMLLYVIGGIVSCLRIPEAAGALFLAPCIMSILFSIASANYLEVDPSAGHVGNAAFTLAELCDMAGCIGLLLGPALGTSSRPSFVSFFMGPVVIFQQALGLYYYLDSFDKSPQSTLTFGSQLQDNNFVESDDKFEIVGLPMHGRPEELLLMTQSVQFAVAMLGICLYGLRVWKASHAAATEPHKEQIKQLAMVLV